jgi:hypothetical protein
MVEKDEYPERIFDLFNPDPSNTQSYNSWRVKVFLMNEEGTWDDTGTGNTIIVSKVHLFVTFIISNLISPKC